MRRDDVTVREEAREHASSQVWKCSVSGRGRIQETGTLTHLLGATTRACKGGWRWRAVEGAPVASAPPHPHHRLAPAMSSICGRSDSAT